MGSRTMCGGCMDSDEEELLLEARDLLAQWNSANDELICECCSITLSDIREFTKENKGKLDLELLKNELKLGSGCSSCVKSYTLWSSKI